MANYGIYCDTGQGIITEGGFPAESNIDTKTFRYHMGQGQEHGYSYSRTYTYSYATIPDGATISAQVVVTDGRGFDFDYSINTSCSVRDKTVTLIVDIAYETYFRIIDVALFVVCDFSSVVTESPYGIEFSNRGASSSLSSQYPPLSLSYKYTGVLGDGQQHLDIDTGIPWGLRFSLYSGIDSNNVWDCIPSNVNGKIRLRFSRFRNSFFSDYRHGNAFIGRATVWILIFTPWSGSLPKFGMAFYSPSGEVTWASNKILEAPSGVIAAPNLKYYGSSRKPSEDDSVNVNSTHIAGFEGRSLLFPTAVFKGMRGGLHSRGDVTFAGRLYYLKDRAKLSIGCPPIPNRNDWTIRGTEATPPGLKTPFICVDDYF